MALGGSARSRSRSRSRSVRVGFAVVVSCLCGGVDALSHAAGRVAGHGVDASSRTEAQAKAMGRFRTWPITAAGELEPVLRDMGLRVDAAKIDGTSTSGAALSDALVSIGASGRGGTGSFVSDEGLILTNWHVAHEAVRSASLALGADFVDGGFVARNRSEEVRGRAGKG